MSPVLQHLVVVGFFLLSLAAVVLHARYVFEVVRDRAALRQADNDGSLADLNITPDRVDAMYATADQFVGVESLRLVINLIVFVIGLGSLFTDFFVLWLLLLIPLASMTSSWISLRRRWLPRRGAMPARVDKMTRGE